MNRLIQNVLGWISPQLASPRTFDFDFLSSTDRIGFLYALTHYSMYYSQHQLPSKLQLYPSWKFQARTLEEWNKSLPKPTNPKQPLKSNKEDYWEYQYFKPFLSYEHTNYKRDKIQGYIYDPLQVAEIVRFIQNCNEGWHLPPPSIGAHFDIINLDILFYKSEEFCGSIGMKNNNTLCVFLKAKKSRFAYQYIREISDDEARFLFKDTYIIWD